MSTVHSIPKHEDAANLDKLVRTNRLISAFAQEIS